MDDYKPTAFMVEESHYDKAKADHAVNFIQCLRHTKGRWANKPFQLLSWQEQIIRDLFGVVKPDGYRQFNTAYIEIPKKNGKSELAAAVALLLLCGDSEQRAEIYGCAADRGQAKIVYDVAADMVRFCPALSKRCKIYESQKMICYLPTNSKYQVLSAEAYSKHGFNIHGVIFDELHTQPNRKLFDVMTQGSGDARTQPLCPFVRYALRIPAIIVSRFHNVFDVTAGMDVEPMDLPVIASIVFNASCVTFLASRFPVTEAFLNVAVPSALICQLDLPSALVAPIPSLVMERPPPSTSAMLILPLMLAASTVIVSAWMMPAMMRWKYP